MEVILGHASRSTSILRSRLAFSHNLASLHCTSCIRPNYWTDRRSEGNGAHRGITHNYLLFINHNSPCQKSFLYGVNKDCFKSTYSSDSKQQSDTANPLLPEKKVSLFAKMKQMAKDYWYILIPVHVATSMGWLALLYVAVKNGVDFESIIEYFNLSGKYVETFKNSNAGTWALIYALYKICTPIRYTITLGGTTMTIRYLNRWGYLKVSSFKKPQQAVQSERHAKESKAKSKTKEYNNQPKT